MKKRETGNGLLYLIGLVIGLVCLFFVLIIGGLNHLSKSSNDSGNVIFLNKVNRYVDHDLGTACYSTIQKHPTFTCIQLVTVPAVIGEPKVDINYDQASNIYRYLDKELGVVCYDPTRNKLTCFLIKKV